MSEESPAFQLYARDLLAATQGLSDAAFGLYLRLLCVEWIETGLPAAFEAEDGAAMIDLLPPGDVRERRRSWKKIAHHFGPQPTLPDDRVGQGRLERIREGQRRYREEQRRKSLLAKSARDRARGYPAGTSAEVPRDTQGSPLHTATASATADAAPQHSAGGPYSESIEWCRWFLATGIACEAIDGHWGLDPLAYAFRYADVAAKLLESYGSDECKRRTANLFARKLRTDADRIIADATPAMLAKHWSWFDAAERARPKAAVAKRDARDIGGTDAVAAIEADVARIG